MFELMLGPPASALALRLHRFIEKPLAVLGHADEGVGFAAERPPHELEIALPAAHMNDGARIQKNVSIADDADEHWSLLWALYFKNDTSPAPYLPFASVHSRRFLLVGPGWPSPSIVF